LSAGRVPRLLLAALAVLALGAAGCGGSQISADEIPGAPVALTIPEDKQTPAADRPESTGSDSDSDDDADNAGDADQSGSDTSGDATGTGTADDAAPAPAPTQAPAPDAGASPDQTQQQPQQDATGQADQPAAPEGSDAQRFEEFCDQNAGAC
jgi:hypothetical protein